MATSGTYTNNFRTGYAVRIVWTADSQNVTNNTTTVTAKVQLISTGSAYTISSSVTKDGTLTINGTSYAFTFSASLSGGQTKTIFTRTVTINHNSDGSKSCAFSASVGLNVTLSGTYWGTVSVSGTGTFDTIPRASTPTLSASSIAMGSAVTISISRASTAFTHTLTYTFGSKTGTIASNVATSASWTLPLALAEAIPKATSGTGSITCQTYSGSTLIGSKAVSFTATVPTSVVPTVNTVTISEAVTSPDIATKFSNFVRGQSKATVLAKASGIYNSTITACKVTIRNAADSTLLATYTASDISAISTDGASITTDYLTWDVETLRIGVEVTDSRGRVASVAYNKTLLPYEPPVLSTFTAYRCDSSGTADYEGSYLNVTINFSISTVNDLNDKYYEILYKVKGDSSWAGTLASGNIYSRNESFVTDSLFSPDNQYDVVVRIWDFFTSAADGVNATVSIATAFTMLDFRSTGKGVAFGKVSEMDAMEINMDLYVKGVRHPEVQHGFTTITPTAVNTVTSMDVTFPTEFSGTPHVTITPATTVPNRVFTSISGASATGFKLYVYRTDATTATGVHWIAVY